MQLLETVTGRLVDPSNPQVDQIDIEDIAWSLSRISRFCGHTITVVPYNVSQHSVFVADKVKVFLTDAGWDEIQHLNISMAKWEEWTYDENPNARNKIILKALLHDAAEVYIGDLPSPIKRIPELTPVIKKIEEGLMDVIYKAFGLSFPDDTELRLIKYADKFAQKVEAHAFMQSRGKHWEGLPDVSLEELQKFPLPLSSLESYKLFLTKFNELHKSCT